MRPNMVKPKKLVLTTLLYFQMFCNDLSAALWYYYTWALLVFLLAYKDFLIVKAYLTLQHYIHTYFLLCYEQRN